MWACVYLLQMHALSTWELVFSFGPKKSGAVLERLQEYDNILDQGARELLRNIPALTGNLWDQTGTLATRSELWRPDKNIWNQPRIYKTLKSNKSMQIEKTK